ncbi:hypothetical protein SCOR_09935 [Sulfidibacter corallicola]|uniref:Uncharacterized protein n=1 Tax=Sulfidibacter corallicola TaxID=2818388 RepID=A0A8A4THI4_SULCO|nr:hypothetical protein [Sulfidibacter corallicola]QTD48632.1 hypothetical protein J3U87_23880 [Sulfidibacter corallicola]QTD50928.1 hypothetical protein J3U87_00535 [Sulfidibacter corallicola]
MFQAIRDWIEREPTLAQREMLARDLQNPWFRAAWTIVDLPRRYFMPILYTCFGLFVFLAFLGTGVLDPLLDLIYYR